MTTYKPHEQELLNRLKESDPDALQDIYQRFGRMLFAYALQLCQKSDDAEDLVHDLMLKLWHKRENIKLHTGLKPYLHKALFRLYQDKRKQQHRYFSVLEDIRNEALMEYFTEDPNRFEELQKQLQHKIELLPPRAKQILMLHKFEQLTYKEIATYLKLSEKTVENHLHKALKLLRKFFFEG